jgi:hypothetical protein
VVELSVSGRDETGTEFQRCGLSTFDVMSGEASLTGVAGAAASDTDDDGLYEKIHATIGVETRQPGTFLVSAELRGEDGSYIGAMSTRAQLGRGQQTISLHYDATTLNQRRINGPYKIGAITLSQVAAINSRTGALSGLLTCDLRAEPILTPPYGWWEFDRPDGRPSLMPVTFNPERGFELIISARRGSRYSLQVSRDLVSWKTISTINGSGVSRVFDPSANPFEQRFYRAAKLP